MAEAFLQAATQAPQPMQAAASMAMSAVGFEMGMLLASWGLPVRMETKPPAWMILSKALRSTMRSRRTGKGLARKGSMTISSPDWKLRM